jgi:ubiquitin-protein ligase
MMGRSICNCIGVHWRATNNPRHIMCYIEAESESLYHGGIFIFEAFLDYEYPMVPPRINWLTPIYHPNIRYFAVPCIDILGPKCNVFIVLPLYEKTHAACLHPINPLSTCCS